MTWNFFKEIGRKTIHLLILFVIMGYVAVERSAGKQYALMAVTALLLVFIFLEFLRLDLDIKMGPLDYFIRPKEIDRMYGVIYFLAATIICLAIFDFRIALTALLMTTFGDMIAAVVGQKYGKKLIFKKKTLEGSLAELGVNLVIGFLVLGTYTNIYVILSMAVIATLVEILVESIDDNLAVPLFAAFIGQILIMI